MSSEWINEALPRSCSRRGSNLKVKNKKFNYCSIPIWFLSYRSPWDGRCLWSGRRPPGLTSLIENSESVSHSSPSYMRLPFIVFPKRTFRGLFCCLRKLMTIFEKTIFGDSKTCRKGREQQTDQKQGLHDHTTFMNLNLNLLMKQKEKKLKTITIVLKHRWRWVSKPAWLLCCQFSFI